MRRSAQVHIGVWFRARLRLLQHGSSSVVLQKNRVVRTRIVVKDNGRNERMSIGNRSRKRFKLRGLKRCALCKHQTDLHFTGKHLAKEHVTQIPATVLLAVWEDSERSSLLCDGLRNSHHAFAVGLATRDRKHVVGTWRVNTQKKTASAVRSSHIFCTASVMFGRRGLHTIRHGSRHLGKCIANAAGFPSNLCFIRQVKNGTTPAQTKMRTARNDSFLGAQVPSEHFRMRGFAVRADVFDQNSGLFVWQKSAHMNRRRNPIENPSLSV